MHGEAGGPEFDQFVDGAARTFIARGDERAVVLKFAAGDYPPRTFNMEFHNISNVQAVALLRSALADLETEQAVMRVLDARRSAEAQEGKA